MDAEYGVPGCERGEDGESLGKSSARGHVRNVVGKLPQSSRDQELIVPVQRHWGIDLEDDQGPPTSRRSAQAEASHEDSS